uniref:Uncharacterized protein LOC8266748 isoform X1 n=1 Tax=Rhizophora mucronata TaxID=61149 RepID=A0A2P2K519_RHIMU
MMHLLFALSSLQGPLFLKSSYQWTHTAVVEYFALLPYVGILTAWLSREGLSSHLEVPREQLLATNTDSSKKTANSSHANATMVECLCCPGFSDQNGSNGHPARKDDSDLQSPKPSENSGCCIDGSPDSSDMPHNMDLVQLDDLSVMHSKQEEERTNTANSSQKLTTSMDRCLNGSTNGPEAKSEMAGLGMGWISTGSSVGNVANGSKNCNISSDQGLLSSSDHVLVTSGSNFKDLDKVCSIISSKGKELTQAALRVILRRRDKLSLQQRNVEDQIAECDKNMQIILNGGEDDLALKIESIIEGYNDVFPQNGTQENTYQHDEDQCSPQRFKRKRLPDAVLNEQNPCQASFR